MLSLVPMLIRVLMLVLAIRCDAEFRECRHYDLPPVVWVNAHWHQFAQPGWRFLANASDGGSGWLPAGGSYGNFGHI